MLASLTVEDLATPEVATVAPDVTVRDAARQLRDIDVGSLVVVGDEPDGILTETDLRDVMADGMDPDGTTVEEVMSSPIVTVASDTDLETAAERARSHSITKLPVVDDGDIVGIVTARDLSYSLSELAGESESDEERVELDVRAETSYEREDWEFEYTAPQDNSEDRVEVGDVARFSKTLSEEDVRAFADASGDTNPLYLDERFAEGTRFGRRVAHSTLTTGVIGAALTRLPGLTLALSTDLQYRGPIDVGDRVTAVCEVTDDLDGNKYDLKVTLYDPEHDPVVAGTATVLVDQLPAEAPADD